MWTYYVQHYTCTHRCTLVFKINQTTEVYISKTAVFAFHSNQQRKRAVVQV